MAEKGPVSLETLSSGIVPNTPVKLQKTQVVGFPLEAAGPKGWGGT